MTQIQPTADDRHAVLAALSLPVLVCGTGPSPTILLANDAFSAALGVELPLEGCSADALPAEVVAALQEAARSGRPIRRQVRLAAAQGDRTILVDPTRRSDGAVDEVVVTVLDAMPAPGAPSVADAAAIALRREREEVAVLLRGALDTVAALVGASTPAAVRERLLRGIVEGLGFEAAALWAPAPAGHRWELVAEVGLPAGIRDVLSRLEGEETAAAITQQPLQGEGATVVASSGWPERHVRLLDLPRPASGILGVYSRTPAHPLVDWILVALSHALASAGRLSALQMRSRTVIDALQRELRPREVALPAGWEAGWWYESATAGVEVGGDFFDVFTTRQGAVGVVCGDVSGKGVEAASLTAMAVHGLRAYARDGAPPDEVARLLNGMACERTAEERFLTLAYALLSPADGRAALTLAGHPPPVRVGPAGVELVPAPADLPIGVVEGAAFAATELVLPPGEALVFYTDGVTEARGRGSVRGALLGTDGLLRILEATAERDAQSLADAVRRGVHEHTAGGTSDDCAVIVLRRVPEGC